MSTHLICLSLLRHKCISLCCVTALHSGKPAACTMPLLLLLQTVIIPAPPMIASNRHNVLQSSVCLFVWHDISVLSGGISIKLDLWPIMCRVGRLSLYNTTTQSNLRHMFTLRVGSAEKVVGSDVKGQRSRSCVQAMAEAYILWCRGSLVSQTLHSLVSYELFVMSTPANRLAEAPSTEVVQM